MKRPITAFALDEFLPQPGLADAGRHHLHGATGMAEAAIENSEEHEKRYAGDAIVAVHEKEIALIHSWPAKHGQRCGRTTERS
jgi:hypothetical protein